MVFPDFNVEMKYTFINSGKISFAIKPGLLIPTGNWHKGLGCGLFSASFFLVNTLNFSPIMVHTNLGYLHNANRHGDALNIWHISTGGDWAVKEKFHFVANTGLEKNPDKSDDEMPAFALAGLYYLITPDCELAAGCKTGITRPESDFSVILGFTFRL
ncbi:MAG: transporter [Bacteroidales bacterium]|nr:transporter [Bacteroidales bacterium]